MFNPLDLTGKLILVTGASSGIGRATAIVLSKLGAQVILNGRNNEALKMTVSEMENGPSHIVAPFDLTQVDQIVPWVRELASQSNKKIGGVVHSAGISSTNSIRTISKATLDHVIVPNLYAAILLLRAVSARSVADEKGVSFVMLSSVAAFVGQPGLGPYSASKGALTAFCRSAAKELAAKRIRINCVAPGYVETPMFESVGDRVPSESLEALIGKHYLGLIQPEEVGVAIAYLMSDAAAKVTGTTLLIDSGFSA
jgi:NAD(P)-dependent dehydrogenase (short-subunit alcohol dehydrogenase family)